MRKTENEESSIFRTVREGLSPAESNPEGGDMKCIRELIW